MGVLLVSHVFAQELEPPGDVENLRATPLDASVLLAWDEADDADGVIAGYKVYYGTSAVIAEGDAYDAEIPLDTDDTEFTVEDLLNGQSYFFAVTALDDQQNESLNYSLEVSATPIAGAGSTSGEGDGQSPSVQSAEHIAPTEIVVTMSETVQVDSKTDAFLLNDDANESEILILDTRLNSEKLTLFVEEGSLMPGRPYRITATSGVTDLEGNPVSSGITDTVKFIAKVSFESELPPAVIEEPEVNTNTEEENSVDPIEAILLDEDRENDEVLIPEDEEFDFLDSFLEQPSDINNSVDFNVPDSFPEETPRSSAPQTGDQNPPQDARGLSVDTREAQVKNKVTLNWTPAVDIDGDIKDQVLYTRVGLGTWDQGYSLGKNATSTELDVTSNQNYQVRLVTIDTSDNESYGASLTFSTKLVQSGGSTKVVALGVAIILGALFMLGFLRRG